MLLVWVPSGCLPVASRPPASRWKSSNMSGSKKPRNRVLLVCAIPTNHLNPGRILQRIANGVGALLPHQFLWNRAHLGRDVCHPAREDDSRYPCHRTPSRSVWVDTRPTDKTTSTGKGIRAESDIANSRFESAHHERQLIAASTEALLEAIGSVVAGCHRR